MSPYRPSKPKYFGFEAEADAMSEVAHAARYDGNYLPFKEAFETALINQPDTWNPSDPPLKPSPFPNELHYAVQEQLETKLGEDVDLKFFTTSGSTLDKKHGIDAVFTLSKKNSPTVFVTVDVTINPEKARRGHKADVIILFPEDFFDEKKTDSKAREKAEATWASEIAPLLQSELESVQKGNMRAQIVNDKIIKMLESKASAAA